MKFIVERDRLVSALSFVSKYSDPSGRIPALATIKFETDEGSVSVTGTDLEAAALGSFPAHVERAGAACISGELLLKAVSGTDATEVLVDAGNKDAAIQIGGRTKLGLPVLPGSDIPDLPLLSAATTHSFTLDASILERVARRVSFAADKDRRGPFYFQGVLWEVRGENLAFCATDKLKLSCLTIPAPADFPTIIVPRIDLPAWEGEVAVSLSETLIRFTNGGQTVASKLIEGSYPEYRRIIPSGGATLLFDRAQLLASLNRMALVGDKTSPVVLFVGRDGKLTLSAQSTRGEIVDEIPYEGGDFQICIKQSILAPVLASFDCENIEVQWVDHATTVIVRDPKDGARLCLAFPYSDARLVPFLPQAEAA